MKDEFKKKILLKILSKDKSKNGMSTHQVFLVSKKIKGGSRTWDIVRYLLLGLMNEGLVDINKTTGGDYWKLKDK